MSYDVSIAAGAEDPFSEAPERSMTDDLAREVARLEHREQESAGRIRRLKAALRMLLDDLTCRVKTQEPVSEALRDFESVRPAWRSAPSVECSQRMRDLGATVRRIRELVGLSQERLAKMAGVSQGAVSRLEAGRSVATPFLVVAKIHHVLDRALANVAPEMVSDDLRVRFEPERFWSSGDGATERGAEDAASSNREFEELVVRCRHLPPTKRTTFLAIMRAALGALE